MVFRGGPSDDLLKHLLKYSFNVSIAVSTGSHSQRNEELPSLAFRRASLYSSLKRGHIISGTVKGSWAPILLSCGYHFFWEEEAMKTTALSICVFTKSLVSPYLTTFPAAVFLNSV